MEFLAIIGDPGSGKTNMLVKYLYAEYHSGTQVVSNIRSIKFPQIYMEFDDFIEAADHDDPRLDGAYVGTDELGVGADSYEFLSARNKGLTKFNTQRRKYQIRWAYTVQRFSMISRRLRLLTDGFISMSDPDKNNMWHSNGRRAKHHNEVCRGVFRAEYFDRNMKLIKRRMFNGRRYWPLYDTREKISADRRVITPDMDFEVEDEDY